MALKIKFAKPAGKHPIVTIAVLVVLGVGTVVALTGFSIFGYYYIKYHSIVDARLKQPLFEDTAKIYATPREVRPGQKLTVRLIANELRAAGYSTDGSAQVSPLGTFSESNGGITVHPGPQSYHAPDSATIHVDKGEVDSVSDDRGQPLTSYELEPLLITGLSEDKSRTKRRLLTYDEIPSNLVNAVVAIEDRRFFDHGGVDYYRMMGALYNDLTPGHRWTEGGSTLTMQLARGFFLSPERKVMRKIAEIAITFQLEHRFTKQQIFQMYANEINLGQRGSFSIDGFGEASEAYFGKDVHQLNLAECALLAGIIQSPNWLNPFRHPDRALNRRNLVLDSMVETGAVTKEQAESAKAEPLHLSTAASVEASEAPYFVDLVRDQLVQKLGDRDYNREGLRIYTSLDPDLQRLATEAVVSTMPMIDAQVDRRHARDKKLGKPYVYPQVALVALNPHTGQVLALVGGRSYGTSQLDHALSMRPTGSIFKPFVYAAAFQTSVAGTMLPGQTKLFSEVTMLSDEQTTYDVGNQEYTPRNYKDEYYGDITARFALMRSDNNATISLASMVGFDNVAALARDAGIKSARGTPTVAIGTYAATPLDMAGAYTVFANGGVHLDPWLLASVRTPTGDVVSDYTPTARQVLDPRVAYLTTNMMEAVLQGQGTGAGVRNMGFISPAAGKTGTEHDAWFAGFTSNLLCIVWVGNDDYTDIKLEGAHAAAPIWADFMKQAVKLPQYSDTHEFAPPNGVQMEQIDQASNLLSDAACPDSYGAAFLDGTGPTDTCDHPPDHRNILQKIFGIGKSGL
ncbi:MAG TPA: PBP1A family penicillin-binding protein [Terracidiphilus sp.]|jgi:penicillin-binding protein 1B|nr:PBP1A family penicillin-binding protein [Terracidiphilus sp.]